MLVCVDFEDVVFVQIQLSLNGKNRGHQEGQTRKEIVRCVFNEVSGKTKWFLLKSLADKYSIKYFEQEYEVKELEDRRTIEKEEMRRKKEKAEAYRVSKEIDDIITANYYEYL